MFRRISVAVAIALIASPVVAQDADFTLVNATGYPIGELYVSPSKAKSWGGDVLGKHIIKNGEAWKITFPQSKTQCIQDIQIVFDDDDSKVVWEGVDLCETTRLTLTYDRKSGMTTATKE